MFKRITLALVAAIIVAGGAIFFYFRPKPIVDNIENWEVFKTSNQNVSLSTCENKEFKGSEQVINAGAKAELTTTVGFTLLKTDNPLEWSNREFRGFLTDKCNNLNFIPVRAYPDKLLWKSNCSRLQKILGCTKTENELLTWENIHAKSSDQEFNEAGIHFLVPPHIYAQAMAYPKDGYLHGYFYTEGNMVIDTSGISLLIPISNATNESPSDEVLPKDERVMINWGNLQGDRIVRSTDRQKYGQVWKGTTITEIYPVAFSNLPIVLSYSHSIHDDTLETLWTTIHNSAQMDLASNLGSYQQYVHGTKK